MPHHPRPIKYTITRWVLSPCLVSALEMAKHKEFTVATNVQVYFCDPQKSLATCNE